MRQLIVVLTLVVASANPALADPPIHECDRLAADPRNPNIVAPGVEQSDVDLERGLAACLAAVEEYPDISRFEVQLGRVFDLHDNYYEAAKWFKVAADRGDVWGMAVTGRMYHAGVGVAQDDVKAYQWTRRAAEQENAYAQNWLAYHYSNGLGVEQNLHEATIWYEKAATQGDANAQMWLGYHYENGLGVEQNLQEAVIWFEKAAAQGQAHAQAALDGAVAKIAALDARPAAEASQQQRVLGYGEWIQDQHRGAECGIFSWRKDQYIYSRWSGICQNGAHGVGQLELYTNAYPGVAPSDQPAIRLHVQRELGLYFNEGVLEVNVPERFLEFEQIVCGRHVDVVELFRWNMDQRSDANIASVSVHSSYVVGMDEIAFDIFKKAAEFAARNCDVRTDHEYIRLFTTFPDGVRTTFLWASINLSDVDSGIWTWRQHHFHPPIGFPERVQKQQAQAAERQRLEEERRAAELPAKQQSRQLYDSFNRQYTVQDWPLRSQLMGNPFMFAGRTVGLPANFVQMIDRDRALFSAGLGNYVLVSKMPRGWQGAPNRWFMLAARVSGNEILDQGLIKELVPTLDFVGALACSEQYCREAFRWQERRPDCPASLAPLC